MEILLRADCGNSPKMRLIQELTVSFASYQIDKIKDYLSDDVKWTLVGDSPIEGKEHFLSALQEMSDTKTVKLTILQILSHGKAAAVHGEMLMQDGKTYGFADFYEFSSASSKKVKAIVSYVITK